MDMQGVLAGDRPDADQRVRYLAKYLTKSLSWDAVPEGGRGFGGSGGRMWRGWRRRCGGSRVVRRCANWLRYGVQPRKAKVGAWCRGGVVRRRTVADRMGYGGRRVLVSRRKWSGKTLAGHKADRRAWALAAAGLDFLEQEAREPGRYVWRRLERFRSGVGPDSGAAVAAGGGSAGGAGGAEGPPGGRPTSSGSDRTRDTRLMGADRWTAAGRRAEVTTGRTWARLLLAVDGRERGAAACGRVGDSGVRVGVAVVRQSVPKGRQGLGLCLSCCRVWRSGCEAAASHCGAGGWAGGSWRSDLGSAHPMLILLGGLRPRRRARRHGADVGEMTSEDHVIAAYARSIVAGGGAAQR